MIQVEDREDELLRELDKINRGFLGRGLGTTAEYYAHRWDLERQRRQALVIAGSASPRPLKDWPAPRGWRDADNRWQWTLATRPDDSFGNGGDIERRAVAAYRQVAQAIHERRQADRSMSLRNTSIELHMAHPAITGMEQGSIWPNWANLNYLADHVGLRIQVAPGGFVPEALADDEELAGLNRQDLVRQLMDRGSAASALTRWFVRYDLYLRWLASDLTITDLSRRLGVTLRTVHFTWSDPFWAVNSRTIFAVAAVLNTAIEAVPADTPIPTWGAP